MPKKSFRELAQEAVDYTKAGIDKLVEVHDLQEALKNLPKSENYEQLVREIIEKEKIAISLIQQATLIKRTLMTSQHKAVEKLIDTLS